MTLYHCCGVNWGESDYREHVERKHDGNYATGTPAPAPSLGVIGPCVSCGECMTACKCAKEPATAPTLRESIDALNAKCDKSEWRVKEPSAAELREPRIAYVPTNVFPFKEQQTADKNGYFELVLVIEMSAYDALKAERDHWKSKYGRYVDKWNEENALANRLKAERDRYKEALKQISRGADPDWRSVCAREALEGGGDNAIS